MVPHHVVSCTSSLLSPFTVYQPPQQRYQCMLCQVATVNSSAAVQTGFSFYVVSISQPLYATSSDQQLFFHENCSFKGRCSCLTLSLLKGELNLDKKWQSDDLFYIIMNEIHLRFNQF